MNGSAPSADTIAAIATPPGQGGIGIIRLSGPRAFELARILSGRRPEPQRFAYVQLRDAAGETLDRGLMLAFASPASFTGEDVVELQLHGSQQILHLVLQALCAAGARLARPGEFSERAFHNGKLDLAQAEAIADLIAAGSAQAARAAQRSLAGVFSQRCRQLHEQLVALRMRLEASIDFPEEEQDFLSDPELQRSWQRLHVEHAELLAGAQRGSRLTEGLCVVLAGAPNVGKSSLLNRLAEQDAAIVTAQPGTTRDVLRLSLSLHGVPVTVIDTAGLRAARDEAESEGIRRAEKAITEADFLLHLSAPDVPDPVTLPPCQAPRIAVHNKCDLSGATAGWRDPDRREIDLSARTGDGVELLIERLVGEAPGDGAFTARRRHCEALMRCGQHLAAAGIRLEHGEGELTAEELRLAQMALGEITGQVHSDELLGRIFASFCIGK